jgi:DNA polymerase III subunit delta'
LLIALLDQVPGIDLGRLHGLTDRLARADSEEAYQASEELLSHLLARLAAGGQSPAGEIVAGESAAMQHLASQADPARWAGLRERIDRNFAAARELNLDRKQTMLSAFFAIDGLGR